MVTITGTITQNSTPVGAGWSLVHGDSGSGIKTTDSNGQFTWDDVDDDFKAVLSYVILDKSGATLKGASGFLIVADGNYIFEV